MSEIIIPTVIKAYINETVKVAFVASKQPHGWDDWYEKTETRIRALKGVRGSLIDCKEKLKDLSSEGLPERSKGIPIRFTKGGVRLSPEEQIDALADDLRAQIAIDEYEITQMEKILSEISDDPYYQSVTQKYYYGKTDEQIGEILNCDPSTVSRNRKRLMVVLVARMWGAASLGVCQ